ncbi:hypothetical protein [Sulfurovum sp.]|jgi:hypothetical protein|uniref:hypothetical protein n=1 Tax=Sulfurovum sp. TaxID=1969726 RepID=UPI0025E7740C|nr:hypothetical protein [Sulfurovum sp.]
MRDMKDLRSEFENFNINEEACVDGTCESDAEADLKDYPSYTEVLYAKLISPHVSGIYISRWDIKDIALVAGDSMAIHPRKRMFELLMKYASNKENMEAVLNALKAHMEDKIAIYDELIQSFPASAEIFQAKVDKARKTMKLFPQIIKEYFE